MRTITPFIYLFLFTTALPAQVETTGFFGNLGIGPVRVDYDEDDHDEGAGGFGFDLRLGYGITPTTTLYLAYGSYGVGGNDDTIFREDYSFDLTELGARFHIGRKVNPAIFYADVAVHALGAKPYDDIKLTGGGISVAPGLLYSINDQFALDAQLRFSGGDIGEIEFDRIDVDLSDEGFNYGFVRLNLGVSLFL